MNVSTNAISEWFEYASAVVMAYRKKIIMGLGAAAFCALGFVGYTYYKGTVNAAAHKELIALMEYYNAPVSASAKTKGTLAFATEEEKWQDVQKRFADAYKKHSGAGIASWYLVYQADALVQLGKLQEAVQVLTKAIADMQSPEMKDFYRLKLALIKLDSKNPAEHKEGLAQLQAIAQNTKHFAQEGGLYYLGAYYWSEKDFAQAKNYWQQLMVKYGFKDVKQQSGYAELVRAKLRLISAEW